MDEYFLKLNKSHNFTKSDFLIKEEVVRYGIENNGQFYGIKYFEVDWKSKVTPLDFFPEKVRNLLRMRYMMINYSVFPHTDSQIDMTVNFYLNTTDEETNFYECVTKKPKEIKLQNQTNGSIFDLNDVRKVCSFKAFANDIYLLNVSKIHSVMNNDKVTPLGSTREAIVFNSLFLSYKEMFDILKTQKEKNDF